MVNVTKTARDEAERASAVTPLPGEMSFDLLISYVQTIEGAPDGEWGGWTRDLVMDRLEAAIQLCQRTAGRVGPRGYGSSMPNYLYSEIDLWYQATQTEEERRRGDRSRNRVVRPATTEQIRLADEALTWPARFVQSEPVKLSLNLWMLSKAVRVPFSRILRERGIPTRTGVHRRDRAVALIVYGLTIEGQPAQSE